jgi:hypothetical protein
MIERRKHRRIVTLKNFGWFMIVALLVLGAMNVVSEHRAPRDDYGRLTKRELSRTPVSSTRAPEVVHEAPVVEAEGRADALVRPGGETALLEPPPPSNTATQQPSNLQNHQASKSISITGDESGITITTPAHKLRGGFGHQ